MHISLLSSLISIQNIDKRMKVAMTISYSEILKWNSEDCPAVIHDVEMWPPLEKFEPHPTQERRNILAAAKSCAAPISRVGFLNLFHVEPSYMPWKAIDGDTFYSVDDSSPIPIWGDLRPLHVASIIPFMESGYLFGMVVIISGAIIQFKL